jgi:alkaline phosphatase D
MKQAFILVCFLCFSLSIFAQNKNGIVSGPMPGSIELRTAMLWIEVKPEVKTVSLAYWKKGSAARKTLVYKGELGNDFNPVKFSIGGLDINTTYQYQFSINGKAVNETTGEFTTKDLWQWRKPAPDFSFIAGSCTYVNEPGYDRPGKPYGGDSSIFQTMAKTPAAFMLWLGDNWYTREVDYSSEWGLMYRPSYDRSQAVLQPLLKAMPHYAIWDDHDYGPNDADKSYVLKEASRKAFMHYWLNPSFGMGGQAIYTKFNYSDVDFFLMDDRWYRSNDDMNDSTGGKPNAEKRMYGRQQMDWLKNALLQSKTNSNVSFRIIVTGSQVLNPVSPFDRFSDFPDEYNDFISFLKTERISGVLFLTGDRHHSEIIKVDREGAYPLYDITASPLTSGTHKFGEAEQNNPYRVLGIDQLQNFAKISVSGGKGNRSLKVEFMGVKGDKLGEWSIGENDLKMKR